MAVGLMWWHWIVLGLGLIGFEMFIGSFFSLWFGVGALITGALLFLVPMSFTAQVLLWALNSGLIVWAWMRYFKTPNITTLGQSKATVVGLCGTISRGVSEFSEGEIIFQRPVMGSDRWPVISDSPLNIGERAKVVNYPGLKAEA